MNDVDILSHSKWNCKYHIVFAPKYRRKVFYEEKGFSYTQELQMANNTRKSIKKFMLSCLLNDNVFLDVIKL